MERLIFHVDVNSAFLSWESVRRLKNGESDLRLVPAVICGDAEKRTSVVLAKSIAAKKLGVKTGEPVSMALRKCPGLVMASPDFSLYERSSKAFMDICRSYAPAVEKYSIDECYLDMSGTSHMYPDPVATAYEIKNKIRDTLGFTVNVGVGPNRLLAKMAGDFEKPDKVHTLFAHEIEAKLWPLPVDDLLSVGGSTAERLRAAQIYTIGQLAAADVEKLCSVVGVRTAQLLHEYSNGIDDSPVVAKAPEAKGYSISTTVEENVTDFESAYRILLSLADSVSGRMRGDGAQCSCVGVTVRYSDFRDRAHQRRLWEATDVTGEIYELSRELIRELWDGHTPIRLIGISLTELSRDGEAQISLFSDERRDKARKLDRAMDSIRSRYGADTILRGSVKGENDRIGRKYKAHLENETEE